MLTSFSELFTERYPNFKLVDGKITHEFITKKGNQKEITMSFQIIVEMLFFHNLTFDQAMKELETTRQDFIETANELERWNW